MSKEEENRIVPKLRFTESSNNGGWEENTLGNLVTKISDGIHSTPTYDDNGTYYFINGNNLIDGKINLDDKTKKVSEEEFKIHKRNLTLNTILLSINGTIGNISIYNNEKVVLGKSACYINIDSLKVEKYFIYYYLQTQEVNKYFISELTGSTIKNLSLTTIKNTIIYLPQKKEQQKIADCLSSLDRYITAESQQLEALKAHKKGLMQQLFPAEGESVPQLRFAEFRDTGEWEEKRLDKLLLFKNGINAAKELYGKGVKFINVLDILQNEFITYEMIIGSVDVSENMVRNFSVDYGDILFQRSSETQEEVGTANVYLDKKRTSTFGGFVIRGKKIGEYEPIFLNKLLKTETIRNSITSKSGGSTRFNIGQETLSSIKVLLPSISEQQKIADCLSSLDELIAAKAEKTEALKLHKKGLMQGLFPNINEVS